MSRQNATATATDEERSLLALAVVGGLIAGSTRPLAGVALAGVGPLPVELHHAAGAASTLALGLHLVYSVIFGAVFVGAVAWALPDHLRRRPGLVVLLGLGFGVVLWIVNVAVGWPLVQTAVGPGVHEIPHLHTGPLVVHVLYGTVLGGVVEAVGG